MKTERCHYLASFSEFLHASPSAVLGDLASANHGAELTTTTEAWEEEIRVMRDTLWPWMDEDAYIIFEYSIPRQTRSLRRTPSYAKKKEWRLFR